MPRTRKNLNLFPEAEEAQALVENYDPTAPLAERMRPRSLDEFTGQAHLLGEGISAETVQRLDQQKGANGHKPSFNRFKEDRECTFAAVFADETAEASIVEAQRGID